MMIVLGYLFNVSVVWSLAGGGISGLVWLLLSLVKGIANEGLLSGKVAALFGVGQPVVYLITGIIGFLLGWIGLLGGRVLRQVLPQMGHSKRRRRAR